MYVNRGDMYVRLIVYARVEMAYQFVCKSMHTIMRVLLYNPHSR